LLPLHHGAVFLAVYWFRDSVAIQVGSLDPHRVIQQQGTLVQLGEFRIPCFFGQELCALIEALIATQLDGQVGLLCPIFCTSEIVSVAQRTS
jgi:hypothetical protein